MARRSANRTRVDRLLAHASGPLSADEVREALLDTGIGIATVYRLLKEGVSEGRFAPVEMPDGPTRYEPADRPHHHHFECSSCNRVFDVHGCPGGLGKLVPEGFSLESHDILLRGVCAACKETAAA